MRVLLVAVLLIGCSDRQPVDRVARKAERLESARAAAAQPPKRSVYRFENGELVVLDIATVEHGFAGSQKCFIWRDMQFGNASLQCPASSEADLPISFGHAEPEKNVP